MTNVGHFCAACALLLRYFRAATKLLGASQDIPVILWVAPTTKMDESELIKEGRYAKVYLASAELAAIASKLGHISTVAEFVKAMGIVNKDGAAIYNYLNFNQIDENV